MDILRSGLLAEFFKVDAKDLDSFVPGDKAADFMRVDPRIDYWTTQNAWKGLPDEFTGSHYAKWTGYIKVLEAGDYYFSLGTSDVAYLEWHDPESNTWAAYRHNGEGTFSFSSTEDHTPETVRTLDAGFHRFRVRFWRKYAQASGLVLKYNGVDTNSTWKVVPSQALYVQRPSCVSKGYPQPYCVEGFIVGPGETCTVNSTLACPEGNVADPAAIVCEWELATDMDPNCVPTEESLGKSEAEEKEKAEAEQKEKAEAEQKAKDEAEQKAKAESEHEEGEAKALSEFNEKADAAKQDLPGPGKSISKWR
jgi:hypothetical protein